MAQTNREAVWQFYAETYDTATPDWPGEIDFYRQLAGQAKSKGAVLEVACGTGRVAIRLAQEGVNVVGIDLSTEMLAQARDKSRDIPNVRWVQADMRSFDLGERFGLVIIPGHSFQNLLTAEDQVACLTSIQDHLLPGGKMVVHLDHQDIDWLGELYGDKRGVFEPGKPLTHPKTGNVIRVAQAWSYERATQTAVLVTRWEAIGPGSQVLDQWQTEPNRFHCVFPMEMEHLLARAGFLVEAVYGDFFRQELREDSEEMIWIATNQ